MSRRPRAVGSAVIVRIAFALLSFPGLAGLASARAQDAGPAAAPVELGQVAWQRDLDRALADSKQSGRPVFLFFQEVPG